MIDYRRVKALRLFWELEDLDAAANEAKVDTKELSKWVTELGTSSGWAEFWHSERSRMTERYWGCMTSNRAFREEVSKANRLTSAITSPYYAEKYLRSAADFGVSPLGPVQQYKVPAFRDWVQTLSPYSDEDARKSTVLSAADGYVPAQVELYYRHLPEVDRACEAYMVKTGIMDEDGDPAAWLEQLQSGISVLLRALAPSGGLRKWREYADNGGDLDRYIYSGALMAARDVYRRFEQLRYERLKRQAEERRKHDQSGPRS